MSTNLRTRLLGIVAAVAFVAAACGGDDDTSDSSVGSSDASADVADSTDGEREGQDDADDQDDPDDAIVDGGGSGTLVIGDETVDLDEVLCHLEPQPAAAGGGNILLVVQGYGVDGSGEDVMIDFTRFDDESMFAGDAVQVYRGDIVSGEAQELDLRGDAGTVTMAGSTARADQLPLADLTTGTEVAVSFEIDC